MLQTWLGDDSTKRLRREIHFPTGRFGEAVEQAHAVLWLASDESSFVNGTDFVVDGGMTKVGVSLIHVFLRECHRCIGGGWHRPPFFQRWGLDTLCEEAMKADILMI